MTSGWLQDDSEHSKSIKQAFREHLKSTQRALREQESNQTSSYHRSSEPKILRLVFEYFPYTNAVASKKKSDIVSPECQIFPREICSV